MQEEKLYDKILSKELTVEGVVRDIVLLENLDPWDIDISMLTQRYLGAIRKMKETDIKVSGKFILAAAILLKMKSDYLFAKEEEEKAEHPQIFYSDEGYELQPNVPIPKKRKVTIEELISSLQKALVVSEKRTFRHKQREVTIKLKLKKIDLGEKIAILYTRIVDFLKRFKTEEITFSKLVPTKQREDMIWTFIPMVHLANKGKISIRQEEEFGEIYVKSTGS